MKRFDLTAFHAAVDERRCTLGLTWEEAMDQINRPFEGTTSIPISISTVRGMPNKRSVTSAVVLQILRWLGRSPESFLTGQTEASCPGGKLPLAGAGQILRFDTASLHGALDTERRRRNLTWKHAAAEMPGFTPGMLTNLAAGPLIGFPRVMVLTQWLGRPAAEFVRIRNR